jgi:hypothetical protein
MVVPPFRSQQLDDVWVRCEGYGGPELGEKSFQLSSLLIV